LVSNILNLVLRPDIWYRNKGSAWCLIYLLEYHNVEGLSIKCYDPPCRMLFWNRQNWCRVVIAIPKTVQSWSGALQSGLYMNARIWIRLARFLDVRPLHVLSSPRWFL
jgi:hypothetical protein